MPYRTRIKVCGITREEDALAAVAEGVDAIGLVFYEPSPRRVAIQQAARIVQQVPAFVDVVALFVDASQSDVAEVVERVKPDLLQFHGTEAPDWCGQFARPYIKALRVQAGDDLRQAARRYAGARALLLDSFQPGLPGGTGQTFDWQLIPQDLRRSIVLAGGLDADNVAEAVRRLRPFAVDVSGGVEHSKGIKDRNKIRSFATQVAATCASIAGDPTT